MRLMTIVWTIMAVSASAAVAQGPPMAVEMRGGLAVATGEWGEEDVVEVGWGYTGAVHFRLSDFVGLYSGWERYSHALNFGDEPELAGFDGSVVDTGFRLGGRVSLPLPGPGGPTPFVLGGLTYGKTEIGMSDRGVSVGFDSDSALGFEAGVGLDIPVTPTLSLTPEARYRSRTAEFDAFQSFGVAGTTVSDIRLDLGFRFAF